MTHILCCILYYHTIIRTSALIHRLWMTSLSLLQGLATQVLLQSSQSSTSSGVRFRLMRSCEMVFIDLFLCLPRFQHPCTSACGGLVQCGKWLILLVVVEIPRADISVSTSVETVP